LKQNFYTYYFIFLKKHLDNQGWRIFGAKGLEDSLQCEDTLDFNVLTYKMDFDRIQNSCDSNV
jgi:hypothetical protein